jgi:hypothetical protein
MGSGCRRVSGVELDVWQLGFAGTDDLVSVRFKAERRHTRALRPILRFVGIDSGFRTNHKVLAPY